MEEVGVVVLVIVLLVFIVLVGVLVVAVSIVELVLVFVSAIILPIIFFTCNFSCSLFALLASSLNRVSHSFFRLSSICFSGVLLQLIELRLTLVAQPQRTTIITVKLPTSNQSHFLACCSAGLGAGMGISGVGGVDCFFLLGI